MTANNAFIRKITFVLIVVFIICVQISCSNSSNIPQPEIKTIKECSSNKTIRNEFFVRCGDAGTGVYYAENRVVKFCERGCHRNNDIYLGVHVYEFSGIDDASSFIKNERARITSFGYWRSFTYGGKFSVLPDEYWTYEADTLTSYSMPESAENNEYMVSKGILFRIDSYVVKCRVYRIFKSEEYRKWEDRYGSYYLDKECLNDLYYNVNYTISKLSLRLAQALKMY